MKKFSTISLPKKLRSYNLQANRGFSLVEVILASSVFVLLVTALIGAYLYGQESTSFAGSRARAVMLAEEGLEAMRSIHDSSFCDLTAGTYGLTTTGNQWNLSGSSDTIDIFTRQVIISSVDSKRKTVTSNVTWQQNPQRTGLVSIVTRLASWLSLGIGSWTNPVREAGMDLIGNDDGIKIQVSGDYAYLVRNDDVNFYVIDISNPTCPTTSGSLSLNGPLTNIAVSGNYAYISSHDNSQEVQIVDISSPTSPNLVGSFNAAGNANMLGIYTVGTNIYAVRDSSSQAELYIVNASTPSAPSLTGSLELGSAGNEVVILGNYAYVASSDNAQELQAIDVSVPTVPVLVGSLNLAGNQNSLSIAGFNSTITLGRADGLLHLINVSIPTIPVSLGSFNTTNDVNDISLGNSNTYAFMAVSANSAEFQIVDISVPASPTLVGDTDLVGNSPLNGVAHDAARDRVFGAGSANSEEFIVIAPQ